MSSTMTPDAARAFLAEVGWGRIGTYNPAQDEIYVVPTFWVIQANDLLFYTHSGKKLENLRAHPNGIAVQAERQQAPNHWISVYGRGKFTEMRNSPEIDAVRIALLDEFRRRASGTTPAFGKIEASRYYTRRTGSTLYAGAVRELMADATARSLIYGRIALEELSGRST